MIELVLMVALVWAVVMFPEVRYTLAHIPTVFYNAVTDCYKWIRYKRWNECTKYGEMNIFIADERQPFGSGKTLNMVRSAKAFYNTYNDKMIFDFSKMDYCMQYVHIYSNLKLMGVPYIPLENTYQLVNIANGEDAIEDDNKHIYVFLFDELGRVFNNRDWKTNINSDLLSALLQQRKNHILIMGTVQDFSLFDATMRKICAKVYCCTKAWRFLTLRTYLAKDIERANFNTNMVATRGLAVNFATDALYNSYDTNEVVAALQKEISEGQHLSNVEILNSASNDSDLSTVTKVAKRYRKRVTK